MDLRIFVEPQQGATYAQQLRYALAAEELGFDAFFRSDHYLAMGVDGRPGPTDAWVTLAGLARETSTIRLGTLVNSATFRLPGPLAIAVAQVDEMSGGRIELGLGTGWFGAEHRAYGIPFAPMPERFDRFAEQVEIVHGLLTTSPGETFSFAGTHYQLSDSPALPKPVQSPLPLVLGGAGKRRSAALAARFADEYNSGFQRESDAEVFDRVRAAAAETGRTLVLSVANTTVVGRDDAELARRAATTGRDVDTLRAEAWAGSPAELVDRLGEAASVGATRAYLQLNDMDDLDHLELIAAEVLPHV